MSFPSATIIIRTLNEAEKLRFLLGRLREQKYGGRLEFVVVDNESRDDTRTVAEYFRAKVVILPRNQFTFPKSMNVGARQASGEILVFTVGHALPKNNRWLMSGLRHFVDETKRVGGVYSPIIPHKLPGYPKRTLAEIFFYYPKYLQALIKGTHIVKKGGMGVLGATNCAVRKVIWENHNFNESYECGGEDGEMAKWIRNNGWNIVCDPEFAVYHSHGGGVGKVVRQFRYWSRLGGPTKFDPKKLDFRDDLDFS